MTRFFVVTAMVFLAALFSGGIFGKDLDAQPPTTLRAPADPSSNGLSDNSRAYPYVSAASDTPNAPSFLSSQLAHSPQFTALNETSLPRGSVSLSMASAENGANSQAVAGENGVTVSEAIDPETSFENFVTKEEFKDEVSKLSWKKGDFTFTPYGFIWVNAAFNSGACVSDCFCLYDYSGDVNGEATSAVDARTSRIGMIVEGPKLNDTFLTKGQVEIDFQGEANMTRNKGQVQLRRAFVELVDPRRELKFQFGQDWDTISPLAPQMLNYPSASFAGNIGYRRAQMRVEKGRTWTPDLHTVWTAGLADPFPGDFFSTSGVSANSGSWPYIEGRVGVSLFESARDGLPITVGLSGHIGENSYLFSPIANSYRKTAETVHLKSWSLNADADLPITKRFRLQGEYYLGENLSGFCGSINQGVDLYRRQSIRDHGGWMSLHSLITDKLTNNTGYGIDKPFKSDLVGTSNASASGTTSARTQNSLIFTNFLYQWSKSLMTGIEFGYWKTDYQKADVSGAAPVFSDMAPGKNFRVDLAVQYLF